MIIMKFGGTSVDGAARMRGIAEIISLAREKNPQTPIVVTASALSQVTEQLLSAARDAVGGIETYVETYLKLLKRHQKICLDLAEQESDTVEQLNCDIEYILEDFLAMCQGIFLLRELSPRALDRISSIGERLSCRILAYALSRFAAPARYFGAQHLLVTDDQFGNATPLMKPSRAAVRRALLPQIKKGVIPVVTGFVGATENGEITTLGRGGSDYTATILANLLDASEVWIYKEIDGVMSADPRIVPDAQTLRELSYSEAAELSHFGAKVLHPKAMLPVIGKNIPVRIKNSFNPSFPGTLITTKVERSRTTVKALSAIGDLCLVNVQGHGMLGIPGIAARTFLAVARANSNVLLITQSSSEQTICLVIAQKEARPVQKELKQEFKYEILRGDIDDIELIQNMGIIAIVGDGMQGTPGIAARIFGALGEHQINIIAIAQGSSERNISVVVPKEEMEKGLRAIHNRFKLGKP